MILISGIIRLASAESVDAALTALGERAARSRQDAGCIDYVFSRSIEDPRELRLLEQWASEAELQAHLAVPDPAFSALLAEADIQFARVVAHTVTESKTLMERG